MYISFPYVKIKCDFGITNFWLANDFFVSYFVTLNDFLSNGK